MANRILTSDYWQQRIRDKMGVDIAYLPDSVTEQPDIINIAESNIISKIPEYDTLTGDLRTYLDTTVVLECCILLCPSMSARLPKKQSGPHANHELEIDWNKRKLEFIDDRNSLIGGILEQVSPTLSDGINSFRITYPKRGW